MRRIYYVLLVLVVVLSIASISYISADFSEEPQKQKVIVQGNIHGEEINRLEIRVDSNTFRGYDFQLEPGYYNYEARLDNNITIGSLEVLSEGTTLLQLHFSEKESTLVGVGRQVHPSPCGEKIAYNNGHSIKIYEMNSQRTYSIALPEELLTIAGWLNEDSLILSGFDKPGTWAVQTNSSAPQLNKIHDQTFMWSDDCRIAAFSNAGANVFEHGIQRCCEDFFTTVMVPKEYEIAAVSSTGAVAYLQRGKEVAAGHETVHSQKVSLYLYSFNGDEVALIADCVLGPDLVRFSPDGRYLTYFRVEENFIDTVLVVYDTLSNSAVTEISDPGIWFDWDVKDNRLLYTKDNQIIIYDLLQHEVSHIYQGDSESRATMVSFLDESKIAFVENGQLFLFDFEHKNKELVDNDVSFVQALHLEHQLLFISDYNFIMLAKY